MTISPTSPTPHLRVFAKVAHTTPRVAAVVRFYLRGAHPRGRPLHPSSSSSSDGAPPPAAAVPTVHRTFQFRELRAFLEAGRARAAVAGMLSLLPLDLGAECSQAWAGFISSVLGLAASRSRRRNLGGMIGIVRIDCFGVAEGKEGDGGGDGFSCGAPQREGSFERSEATARSASEDGGCGFEGCSCPICYEAFGRRLEVARTPCGHGFHGPCIARWLRASRTCPVCRFEMPKEVGAI